ncbi:MAG: twin-arginine translocase subunit TatB [Rhodospirillales bacterium]|nr:twin-arginine translocase subunit TatB [Rhodospirillales bacterium]
MFDIGWQELFILAVIAIIVIGPKDLPRAIRTITKGLRKARSMARDLQESVDDVVREAELDDLKNTIGGSGQDIGQRIKDATDLDFDVMDLDRDVREQMTAAAEDMKAITDPGASGGKAEKADAAKNSKPKKTKSKKTAKTAKTDKTAKATKTGKTRKAEG